MMDRRITELVNLTKTKFGLDNYFLQSHSLRRNVNIFNETIFTLSMEWFPNHVIVPEDDDSNPEGTAVIDVDVTTRKYESVIFVMDKTYANNGVTFAGLDRNDMIKWIERETGLTYGKQFQLYKEEEGRLLFNECIDGIAVSPSGSIEIKLDNEGRLTFFSVLGQFSTKELVKDEKYTLTFESVEHLAKEQLKLIEFPSFEQEKLFPIYAVEEVYVTNENTSLISFEFIEDVRSYQKIGETIHWDEPVDKPFDRKEVHWLEEATVEQAFTLEPSPDSFPITKVEKEKCLLTVRELLRQDYPKDTGKWILKTLHRENGYINAILRMSNQTNRVFKRKLVIIIDPKSFQAVNYVDNKPMLEMFDHFSPPEEVTITREEAYEKIKDKFEINPYYVYDFDCEQYVLCGKIDCEYGVNGSNGEIVALGDL